MVLTLNFVRAKWGEVKGLVAMYFGDLSMREKIWSRDKSGWGMWNTSVVTRVKAG